eukprot:5925332-Prymnesium_polylepis.3
MCSRRARRHDTPRQPSHRPFPVTYSHPSPRVLSAVVPRTVRLADGRWWRLGAVSGATRAL